MHEYGLTSEEGVILMCIAEALLRIPDSETADALIAEKIAGGQWERHLGHSDSLFVNASTWGLMLTGRVVRLEEARGRQPARRHQAARRALRRAGDPPGGAPGGEDAGRPVRARPHHRGSARARRRATRTKGYLFSYDMLGEARAHAEGCRRATSSATWRRSRRSARRPDRSPPCTSMRSIGAPGISVKLSALHPRFEPGKEAAPRRGADAASAEPGARRALARAVAHDRCGGAGSPRSHACTISPPSSPIRRSTAGTVSASPCRPTASAPSPCCAGCGASPSAPASASPSASSRAPTGTARSNGRRSAGSPTIPCSRASCTPTSPTSRACACCSAIPRPSIRSSRPTTPTRLPPRTSPAAPPCSSSSGCTAWAKRSMRT